MANDDHDVEGECGSRLLQSLGAQENVDAGQVENEVLRHSQRWMLCDSWDSGWEKIGLGSALSLRQAADSP